MERVKGAVIDEGCGGDQQNQKEFLGVKLRRGISIAKRGGTSTPVPTWKVDEDDHLSINQDNARRDHRRSTSNTVADTAVSARKLGANLWEIQDMLPVAKMSRGDGDRGRHRHRKGGTNLDLAKFFPLSPHDRTQSMVADRWHASRHKSREHNGGPLQPVSPASYSSSMKMAAYNRAMTPTSSLGIKGRLGESGHNIETSTELLKVLNRIWSLEEQHASNISMMKALKLELNHAKTRIQDLVEERQIDKHEIDALLKKVAENNVNRKSKEREKFKAAVQNMKDEVDGERRLRKHSENLHRKIAKEFSEIKSSFSKALIDLEKETKVRALLEGLCDEFAKGVVEYEQEIRELKQKSEMDSVCRCDRLVLHIAEAWLDERLQMKLAETRGDPAEINTIVDRLGCEIESFLKARRTNVLGNGSISKKDAGDDNYITRQSLESVHLNGATSAPQDAEDEDSVASDFHCFEINMGSNYGARGKFRNNSEAVIGKSDVRKAIGKSAERICDRSSSSANLQSEEQNTESGQWNCPDRSDDTVENFSKGQLELPDYCGTDHGNDHSWRGRSTAAGLDTAATGAIPPASSPVQQFTYRNATPDTEVAESSSKSSRGGKENTLKAKLLEAKLEGQHARLRTSRASSFCA